ncbi:MAG: alpha/beta fold hydrolase [Pseudomonadota bacterium]
MAVPEAWRAVSGDDLAGETVKLRIVGQEGGPVVIVLGGISAGRFLTSHDGGWWAPLAGPGRVIDTDHVQVVGVDLPPHKASAFKRLCPEDFAKLLALALDVAGLPAAETFIGASFGGMVGLAFARLFPRRVGHLVLIAAAHRPCPMAYASRRIQRDIIAMTHGTNRQGEGVALARQLAMTTYRTSEEFDARFGPWSDESLDDYLDHQGAKCAAAITPERYWALSSAIDQHREDPADIEVPVSVIASDSDRLVPLSLVAEMAARLPNLRRYDVMRSSFGHDAFLKEESTLSRLLRPALGGSVSA